MKRATVVIGANYGDEGKGLVVDYLASRIAGEKTVVRFNGGAQAGHTVVAPDGARHVFSHFGSGTLAGARTYLAKHFVCNPILFWKEARQLHELGARPVVAADPRCFVTTPYDMIINQDVEDQRGSTRHGSVGVGFGETIERNLFPAFQLLKSDLEDEDTVRAKLRLIRDRWVPARRRGLGLPAIPADDTRLDDARLEKTVEAFLEFGDVVTTAGVEFIERKPVIFEGAQGLCLDMHSGNFPHVTRSNTGLTNVMPIARMLGLSLDVIYVTRPYLTKHGAGPLRDEYTPDPPIIDETNTVHPYQGALRFARLSLDDILWRTRDDARQLPPGSSWSFAVTCTDHVPGIETHALLNQLDRVRLTSAGPSRTDVLELKTVGSAA